MNLERVKVVVIAEIGSVHDGSLGNALCLIDAAVDCGVDAVKFQTYIPEAETSPDAPMPSYFRGEPRFEYFKRTGFTLEQWRQLKQRCSDRGVLFFSSPFSEEAVDLLESVGLTHYKIPSGEITNHRGRGARHGRIAPEPPKANSYHLSDGRFRFSNVRGRWAGD